MFAEKLKNLPLLGIALALVFTILVQCKKNKEIADQSTNQPLPQKKDSLVETAAPKPAIKYTSMIFSAKKKDSAMVVMVGRKFRPFFMLSFKNLVGISSSKND